MQKIGFNHRCQKIGLVHDATDDQEAAEEMWEFSANDDDASKLHTHDDKSTRKK